MTWLLKEWIEDSEAKPSKSEIRDTRVGVWTYLCDIFNKVVCYSVVMKLGLANAY